MKKAMSKLQKTHREDLLAKVEHLESRLAEAEETLRAISSGEVDALAIETATGAQIFTLKGAEQPYRVMVETMSEGAVTLVPDGMILYCNQRFADMVKTPLESIVGDSIYRLIPPKEKELFKEFVEQGSRSMSREQIHFQAADGASISALISMSDLRDAIPGSICLLVADITELQKTQQALQKSHKELKEAIEKQRLLAAELLMTEVRERRRIAADLHDNICQSLAVAKIKLYDLQARVTEIDLEKPLIEIRKIIGDAIDHTRSLLQDISSSALHELGLSAALDALAEQINAKYGLAVILESPQSIGKIDEEVQVLLYQAVRELLLNIIKHAKVSTAFVSIQEIGSNIRVQVKDDGVGFDVSAIQTMFNQSGGFGLFNIRERLKLWDGHMEIKSGHDMGTCITISVPHKKRSQQ